MLACGVGPGDVVWTSPNSFVASANAALYCGAGVDFVDIDPITYNMSVDALEDKLMEAAKIGVLPKVVIPVHFAGQSCEMDKIKNLSDKYNFFVIEDASHAIGGSYLENKIGGCRFSDMAFFSFHPVKIITTGEGGMVLTNNRKISERLKLFRSHGVTRDRKMMSQPSDGGWYYQQIGLGYNYRMTDIQAALGLSQSSKLDYYIDRRNKIASFYRNELKHLPIKLPQVIPQVYSAYHLYVIKITKNAEVDRDEAFKALRDKGIGVNVHYIPIHTQPFYLDKGFSFGDFPKAEDYYRHALSLPIFPSISDEQLTSVVKALKEVFQS